jgi:hypothetical protein
VKSWLAEIRGRWRRDTLNRRRVKVCVRGEVWLAVMQKKLGQHAAPERVISDRNKLLTISDGAEGTLLLG